MGQGAISASERRQRLRDDMQKLLYRFIDPFVKLLVRAGITPNMITTIGFMLNIGVAVIFIVGGEVGHRGDYSYIGWAGGLILFAGLFDMLDGQVARLAGSSSSFGALYDSVIDRYSELVVFLGVCYYLVSHDYFFSSLLAFIALIGSLMVSYVRARAEGLGSDGGNGGVMQRPERVILMGVSALTCGLVAQAIGGDYQYWVPWLPFAIFETISVFTIPIAVMALLTNMTAIKRLLAAKRSMAEGS